MTTTLSNAHLGNISEERAIFDIVHIRRNKILKTHHKFIDGGFSCDFVVQTEFRLEYVEVKGGRIDYPYASARKTCNIKKAGFNGQLLKVFIPNAYYVVYFIRPPVSGSDSDKMLKISIKQNWINEVRYFEDIDYGRTLQGYHSIHSTDQETGDHGRERERLRSVHL